MRFLFPLLLLVTGAVPAAAQFTNRYPRIAGMSHHVYLEGYELPTMNAGPTDPAVAPGGARIAFSARGWIWVLDAATGHATRITDGAEMDFRPAWSPDGRRLAFVRDDTRDTWIVVRDLATGRETRIDTPALDLDPTFTPGDSLIYSSAREGQLDLWRSAADGSGATRLTTRTGLELKPTISADGATLVYLHKGGGDRVIARTIGTDDERELATEWIVSQTRPAVSPDGRMVVYGWARDDRYELRLISTGNSATSVRLTGGSRGLPLAPAWSPDGAWVWFTEAGADEVMRLYRIPTVGGRPEEIVIRTWDWGRPTGIVRIATTQDGASIPSRLTVTDAGGHPAVPTMGFAQFALQHGRIFFYSSGTMEVVVPAGTVSVTATRGLTTPAVTRTAEVRAGDVTPIALELSHVWDSRAAGFLSGDHHFHLNYGGPYTLDPEDLLPMMRGEQLDVATPAIANLHNRFEEQQRWGWSRTAELPLIQFAQEVRSHFLGHVGLLNTRELFWPWIWGPGYQVYGTDDRPNAEPLQFARAQGGMGGYVHPVSSRNPLAEQNHSSLPVLLAVDGILGNIDWLEVACLWSDEIGTATMWYQFLNLGHPVALEAGTDVMTDYYRTMAVGTTRLYVQTGGSTRLADYWTNMKAGRSFVTSGPMLLLSVAGRPPGDAVPRGGNTAWELTLHSAVPVDTVELLVNGEVVWTATGVTGPGSRTYSGRVRLPAGGWVAARARGGDPVWPAMDSYAFAHTSPVWIGRVGSTDRAARRRAAAALSPVVDAAERRLIAGYGGAENVPKILESFAAARRRLAEASR